MTSKELYTVKSLLYINSKSRYANPCNLFDEHVKEELKSIFWAKYKERVAQRGRVLELSDQITGTLKNVFQWAICDPEWEGDFHKGILLASRQGFGKDVILKSLVDFFRYFDIEFKRFTYDDFGTQWYEKYKLNFLGGIMINDIRGNGKIKRERESIPFLEFLDYRDQINSRRGLIASTNMTIEQIQNENEQHIPEDFRRLSERIKECYNVIKIIGAESKRHENEINI